MNIANYLSIKHKTYLLVLLSVVVALILSLVSKNGLDAIRMELDHLIFSTKIERYTNKLILEEQRYRLNANGSINDFTAATQAYNHALKYVDEIHITLDQINHGNDKTLFHEYFQNTRESTDEYKKLYIRGAALLTELNKQAGILEAEGESITLQIQQYVESKRLEIKQNLSNKTIGKINNGSNIWQFTYVIRLDEKKYLLSPDDVVLKSFKSDYQFMMNEWARLKKASNQDFELEKLDKFYASAKAYEHAMLLWTDLNRELVTSVLPKMMKLGDGVITRAIQSAEKSIKHMSEKRNDIAMTLIMVTTLTILMGIISFWRVST